MAVKFFLALNSLCLTMPLMAQAFDQAPTDSARQDDNPQLREETEKKLGKILGDRNFDLPQSKKEAGSNSEVGKSDKKQSRSDNTPSRYVPPLPGQDRCQSQASWERNFFAAGERADNLPPGSAEHLKWTRRAAEAGYCYIWDLLDKGQSDEADLQLRRVVSWLEPYDKPNPVAQVRLSLARLAWLKSRIASEAKRTAEDDALVTRVLALTADREAYLPDYAGLSKLRVSALSRWKTIEERDLKRAQACKIVDEMESLLPNSATRRAIECIANEADLAVEKGNEKALIAAIAKADALYAKVPTISNGMAALSLRTREIYLSNKFNQSVRRAKLQLDIIENMTKMFDGQLYFQNSTDEVYTLYSAVSCECVNEIPEYAEDAKRYRKIAEVYSRLSDALGTSLANYPSNLSYASVAADAAATAANAYNQMEEWQSASIYSERARSIADRAQILAQLKEHSEQGASVCKVYGKAVETQIGRKSITDATTALASLDTNCGAWLQRFPWDFYARQHLTSAKGKYGIFMADQGKIAEALPTLRFASNWGVKDATKYLAKIYGDASSPFADAKKAEMATKLQAGQSLKRFTVPTDFAGVKYPFNVYITQYGDVPRCPATRALTPEEAECAGFVGIDDQATWVKEARSGVVPEDVVTSFQKLDKIAKENKVSFPDLAVYALGAAKNSEFTVTEAQAKIIQSEMVKTSFRRNPDRWLDPAGLALNGYDPVSYTQGDKPVLGNPDFFTLWDGALWLFSKAANRDEFLRNPSRFSPQYGGFSSAEILDGGTNSGKPTIFSIINNKLYLFDSEHHISEWKAKSSDFVEKADNRWLTIFPNNVDAESPLSKLITKIGPVAVQDRVDFYARACQANRVAECGKLFELVSAACADNKSIQACGVAIKFAEVGQLNTRLVSLLGNRSWYYSLDNKPDEAIADAKRALTIDANQPWINGNLANGLLIKGDVAQAILIYKAQRDKLGPGKEGTMCPAILGDISAMLEKKVIEQKTADRVRKAILCK